MSKCSGCGAVLQTSDKEKIGYIPKEKFGHFTLCERCFRILHYNDLKLVSLPPLKQVLEYIHQNGSFAFFLVDLLNINQEVIDTYLSIRIPKVLLFSKIDYLPKYIKLDKIKMWLRDTYGILEDVFFLSAKKNFSVNVLLRYMNDKNIKSAYLLGYTNAGKSTLINSLQENNLLTTSLVPNTTLDFISVPLEKDKEIIDSPGFLYMSSIYENDMDLLKKITPKSVLKPITFQLKEKASILIERLLRIENLSKKCNLTFYMSSLLRLEKVYEKNGVLKDLEKYEFVLKDNQDLVIKGLGFIHFKEGALVHVYISNSSFIEVRDSFF